MDTLLWLAAIIGIVWFWADSARARELALKRCRSLCEELNVQLLDQTVGLARLGFARSALGRLQVRRRYAFEYSVDGTDRWRGLAELRGHRIESIHLQHPDGPIIVRDARHFEAPRA